MIRSVSNFSVFNSLSLFSDSVNIFTRWANVAGEKSEGFVSLCVGRTSPQCKQQLCVVCSFDL